MTEKKCENLGDGILELRKILRSMDWKDDGVFRIPTRPDGGYTYLSAEKTKKQFNEALETAGLNMAVEYSELTKHEAIGNMSQHWTVKCTMTIYGGNAECVKYTAYGEAGDSGDKGVNKAQTDAIKQIVFNQFLVADCSDPDANTSDIEIPAVGRAIPKTPAQKQAVKEKMAESQVKPAEQKPVEQTAKPAEKTPAQLAEDLKAKVTAGAPPANAIQLKAMQNILDKVRKEVADGTLSDTELTAMEVEAEKAKVDSKLASQFIIKHRRP